MGTQRSTEKTAAERVPTWKPPVAWGLALLWLLTAGVGVWTGGLALGVLVTSGWVLLLALGLAWTSLGSLTDEEAMTIEDALHLAAPSEEEEQKRAVLRALRDLDYERSLGKLTEAHYATLTAHYRAQAKRLLRSLDEETATARARIEAALEARLAGVAGPPPTRNSTPDPLAKDRSDTP